MNNEVASRLKSLGLAIALLLSAGTLPAEEPRNPKTVDQLIVIGSRPIEAKVVEEAATPFIHSHSVPGRVSGQIARWKTGICPLTRGLPPAYDSFITQRVRVVAQSVGAPVDEKTPCRPNIEIIFTTEPQQLLDEVVRDHEFLLGFHWTAQTKKLSTVSRPLQAWYVTATTSKDGVETLDDQQELLNGRGPSPGLGSRLFGGTTSAIVHVLIVADTAKLVGYTIGSISDYVALLALSQARTLDECSELPSILDLMTTCADNARPESVSNVDTAYLKALYRIDMHDTLFFQQTEINVQMIKELEGR